MISLILTSFILISIVSAKKLKKYDSGVLKMDWDESIPLPEMQHQTANKQLPIVVWHGLGDFCENPISMIPFVKFVKNITQANVYCLQIGDTWNQDAENGWLLNINKQLDYACNLLAKIPDIKNGFYGMGLSQGGLFIRGLKQRCAYAKPMKRLISIGGPQQGVEGIPSCNGNTTICEMVAEILSNFGIYSELVQDNIVPAEYWHDSLDLTSYLKYSAFLPDINNERAQKNPKYKQNLLDLETFVMVKFTEDTVVFPRDSEWFGFFAPGSDTKRLEMRETELYQKDFIGLKQLDQANKIHFLSCPTNHLRFTHTWFVDNVRQYLLTK